MSEEFIREVDEELKEEKAASLIESAIGLVLDDGFRTKDIFSKGSNLIGTSQMTNVIIRNLDEISR